MEVFCFVLAYYLRLIYICIRFQIERVFKGSKKIK